MARLIYLMQSAGELFNASFTPSRFVSRIGEKCSSCGVQPTRRIFPAEVNYSGEEMKDFANCPWMMISSERVAKLLTGNFAGIQAQPVKILSGHPPTSEHEPNDVADDYRGKRVVELWPTLEVSPNPDLSSLTIEESCGDCGNVSWHIEGVETTFAEVKRGDKWVVVPPKPRIPGKGIILQSSMIGDRAFFRFDDFGKIFCVEEVKDFILAQKFSNVEFREYGEVVG